MLVEDNKLTLDIAPIKLTKREQVFNDVLQEGSLAFLHDMMSLLVPNNNMSLLVPNNNLLTN